MCDINYHHCEISYLLIINSVKYTKQTKSLFRKSRLLNDTRMFADYYCSQIVTIPMKVINLV